MIRDEKGSILIMLLMVIVLLSLLGASFYYTSMIDFEITDARNGKKQAHYLAETGMKVALGNIKHDLVRTNPVSLNLFKNSFKDETALLYEGGEYTFDTRATESNLFLITARGNTGEYASILKKEFSLLELVDVPVAFQNPVSASEISWYSEGSIDTEIPAKYYPGDVYYPHYSSIKLAANSNISLETRALFFNNILIIEENSNLSLTSNLIVILGDLILDDNSRIHLEGGEGVFYLLGNILSKTNQEVLFPGESYFSFSEDIELFVSEDFFSITGELNRVDEEGLLEFLVNNNIVLDTVTILDDSSYKWLQ